MYFLRIYDFFPYSFAYNFTTANILQHVTVLHESTSPNFWTTFSILLYRKRSPWYKLNCLVKTNIFKQIFFLKHLQKPAVLDEVLSAKLPYRIFTTRCVQWNVANDRHFADKHLADEHFAHKPNILPTYYSPTYNSPTENSLSDIFSIGIRLPSVTW